MNRWLMLVLVGAFVLAGAGVFFLYDKLVKEDGQDLAGLPSEKTSVTESLGEQPTKSPTTTANTRAISGPGWALNCKSEATEKEFECRMSQTVVAKQSRRVLANVTFRIQTESKEPKIVVQLPLGLYLPAGATYQVDENPPQTLDFRACDRRGCYAQTLVTPDTLASLKKGKQLTLSFQNLAQKPIKISLSLGGFEETFDKIQGPS